MTGEAGTTTSSPSAYRFTDKNDGAEPNGAVVFDKTGKHLYGTAIFGGTHNGGVVYEITP